MRWQWKYISCFHPATRSSVQSIASALLVTSVRMILQAVELMMKNFTLNDFVRISVFLQSCVVGE